VLTWSALLWVFRHISFSATWQSQHLTVPNVLYVQAQSSSSCTKYSRPAAATGRKTKAQEEAAIDAETIRANNCSSAKLWPVWSTLRYTCRSRLFIVVNSALPIFEASVGLHVCLMHTVKFSKLCFLTQWNCILFCWRGSYFGCRVSCSICGAATPCQQEAVTPDALALSQLVRETQQYSPQLQWSCNAVCQI